MSGMIGTSHSKSKAIGRSQDTAKAWINFNGTGTPAIRDSFNFSSITDHGTGDYTLTFINAMSNTNYVSSGMAGENNTSGKFILIKVGDKLWQKQVKK